VNNVYYLISIYLLDTSLLLDILCLIELFVNRSVDGGVIATPYRLNTFLILTSVSD